MRTEIYRPPSQIKSRTAICGKNRSYAPVGLKFASSVPFPKARSTSKRNLAKRLISWNYVRNCDLSKAETLPLANEWPLLSEFNDARASVSSNYDVVQELDPDKFAGRFDILSYFQVLWAGLRIS